jgi:uncharacterized protein YdeI (YjbR/CyaY-like superfamily)
LNEDLPVMTLEDGDALRRWLELNHDQRPGLWVRIFKGGSGVIGVTFEDVLEAGLCFGWSEGKRIRGDETSYLQRFTPRRRKGTDSDRNRRLAKRLLAEGKMTASGLDALGMRRAADPGEASGPSGAS